MQVSGVNAFTRLNSDLQKRIGNKTPYKNRAFILKIYLVLFGTFIVTPWGCKVKDFLGFYGALGNRVYNL